MANSMRVKSSSEYIIEVNDRGDTISFDPGDLSLSSRYMKAFERIDALTEEYEAREREILTRPDEPLRAIETPSGDTTAIMRNEYDRVQLLDELYSECRKVMDGFLGAGACEKIFGDKNWITMYEDLGENLAPHLKKIGVTVDKIRTRAAQKHAPNRAARRALK